MSRRARSNQVFELDGIVQAGADGRAFERLQHDRLGVSVLGCAGTEDAGTVALLVLDADLNFAAYASALALLPGDRVLVAGRAVAVLGPWQCSRGMVLIRQPTLLLRGQAARVGQCQAPP